MQSYRRPWIIVWNVATLHHQSFPCHLCTSGSAKLIFIVNTIIAPGSGIVLFIAVTLLWLPQMLFQMLIPSEMLPVLANLTYVPFNKKFMTRTDQTMWISQGIVSETGLSAIFWQEAKRKLRELTTLFFFSSSKVSCLPAFFSPPFSGFLCVIYIYVWCFKVFFYMTNRETMFTLCSHEQNSYTFNFKMRKLKSWIRTHSQQWHDWIRFLLTQLFVQCSHHCNSEM